MTDESIRLYHALGDCLSSYKIFLSLHIRYFFPFLYEILHIIRIISTSNILLKNVFACIWWIPQFIVAINVRIHLNVISLAMGAKVSLKSTPAT